MTPEIGFVFLIIAALIVLFAFEIFPIDKISFCLVALLAISGIISPEEAISGFSNRAVITILCLMIIGIALEQNGVISWMAKGLKHFRSGHLMLTLPVFMFITGSVSAFISSTAVVIVFIKIVTELHDKYQMSKSKLLLPISFAAILGGSCTLMGTSTNLLVDSIIARRTEERLGFFEFSWLGIQFLIVAIILITLLYRILPKDSHKKLTEQYGLGNYITTIELAPESSLAGKKMRHTFLGEEPNITLLKLFRKGGRQLAVHADIEFREGDRLVLSCDMDSLMRFTGNSEFIINPEGAETSISPYELKDLEEAPQEKKRMEAAGQRVLVELMMLPGAQFLGKTLRELRRHLTRDAIPIAIKKRKNLRFGRERLYKGNNRLTHLKVGDRVLVEINREAIRDLDLYDNVAVLQEYETPARHASYKRPLTLFVLVAVIILAATGLFTILASALFGCMVLLIFNCISLQSVYNRIDWPIIFLLAGMIPLGIAMHSTGADDWIASALLNLMDGKTPLFSLGLLFLITMLISSVVSNNATAIIMAPIAISLAMSMSLPVKPYILAVMFASNFSFFTPVGYQTNALVYSMGIYTFRHFFILGGIISVVLWVMATLLLNSMIT